MTYPIENNVPIPPTVHRGRRGKYPFTLIGSMTEYIRQKNLLPSAQIDALIALTPTDYFHKEDFEREGIRDWQDWIARIIKHSEHVSQIMA